MSLDYVESCRLCKEDDKCIKFSFCKDDHGYANQCFKKKGDNWSGSPVPQGFPYSLKIGEGDREGFSLMIRGKIRYMDRLLIGSATGMGMGGFGGFCT